MGFIFKMLDWHKEERVWEWGKKEKGEREGDGEREKVRDTEIETGT